MESSDFDAKTKGFLTWFKALPGASFSDSIQIVDLRSRQAGRGIGMSSRGGCLEKKEREND